MRRYPGLSPFSENQKDLFFGRKDDIRELSKLIFIERKVLLYSKSGYGKTSLLNAGVIPELKFNPEFKKNNEFEFIKIRFRAYTKDGSPPVETFLQTVKEHDDFAANEEKKTILDEYAAPYMKAFWSVFKKNQLLGNSHKTYILVFDQFEELFSYPNEQIDEFKNQFSDIIHSNKLPRFFEKMEESIFENKSRLNKDNIELLYKAINIKAVFAMRSDRLSQLNYLADKISDIQKVFYELKPLSLQQARWAIEEPARKEGVFDSNKFSFTQPALEKILSFLTNNDTQNVESTQLQIVCQRIEEQDDEDGIINDYEVPDFKNIFTDFYNSAIAKLPEDKQDKARLLVEEELIRSKQRISLDRRVCERYLSPEAIQLLIESYLIRGERNSVNDISYELSHDSLIEPITDLAENRHQKEKEAEELRLKNEELRAAKERQRRQLRIIALSLVVAAVSIGAAIFGFVQKNIAEDEKHKAEKALKEVKKANYDKFINEAKQLSENAKFTEAIKSYNNAKPFTNDTNSINNQIADCKKSELNVMQFNDLIDNANLLLVQENFEKANELYSQAKKMIDNEKVNIKLKELKMAVDKKASNLRDDATHTREGNEKNNLQAKAAQMIQLAIKINQQIKK